MSSPRPVFLVVVRDPAGRLVPISVSESEEKATKLAHEAMEQVSLGLSFHASQAKLDETRRLFESIDVRRAWLMIEGDDDNH